MGISTNFAASPSSSISRAHYNIHKLFLLCNYILLGAASSCIFLTLSLRLVPSVCGFFLIFLHAFTIAGAISGLALASAGTGRWFGVHMVFAVLTAIFQGSVAVLVFTRTGDFLGELRSYVREEDGAVILKLGGGLSAVIFCLEWIVLVLAFWLKYYMQVEDGGKRSAKVQQYEESSWAAGPFPV
ncbi:uncharacterized protein LOC111014182 [Momordica charantia]|uniref:Uncharacterized protein LOC111014182 n=1 Tax=Momordica charantia TaxID=3673 RepID=A0A6J1CSI3_MOMCH|nr:uncharacterized protein LOC111014182 [Momordica charantia]